MFQDAFRMSRKAIMTNKMRSFLTMLGIIIGVFALVVLVSIANGTNRSITDSINSLGTNTLTVRISDDKGSALTIDSLSTMMEEAEHISAWSASASSTVTAYSSYSRNYAEDGDETASVSVTGTEGSYADIQGLDIESGRYFNVTDLDNHTNVIVINADLAETIMGRINCVGEEIKLNGVAYEIIGVLAAEDSSSSGGRSRQMDYTAYIPYTSLIRLASDVSSEVTEFTASPASEDEIDSAESELEQMLLARLEEDSDAFTIQNQSEIAEAMEDVSRSMAMMLGGIAAISLLVGGIGIMNIMLVSVTERTREIGIRKAIGATRRSILLQFLIEAMLISLLGCAIGIGSSWLVLFIVRRVTEYTFTLSMGVVWVSILFSTAIGVIFGLYPASRAARKDPVEALRYAG